MSVKSIVTPISKFRNATNGLLLKGIFYETTLADKSSVVFTLKDWDHPVGDLVYPSLYRLYMECNDPTEYKFATTHLESWQHWVALCECNWFKPYVERWRSELEVRMKSQALARIMSESKTGGREAFSANKYLLEKGWEPKEGNSKGRGRPSKEEIKKAATEIASANVRLEEDMQRIMGPKLN